MSGPLLVSSRCLFLQIVTYTALEFGYLVITSAKEVMFYLAFVCVFVCLFVCLL